MNLPETVKLQEIYGETEVSGSIFVLASLTA